MEEVRETLATAKLISLLDRETAAWTRNAKPKTCMDAGEIAHLFAADRPTTAYPKMRFDSKEKSGVPQPQPQPRLANKMSKEEIALAWDKDKGPRCFRCSEFGHVARECAKPRVKSDVKMEPKISNFGQKMSESSSAASSDSLHSSLGDAPLVMPVPTTTPAPTSPWWRWTSSDLDTSRQARFPSSPYMERSRTQQRTSQWS